ncbi:hypothetical protein L7F22_022821 [Adiantum nelumboides]|nr:hypothetical protein [Adiantum nelumboides]
MVCLALVEGLRTLFSSKGLLVEDNGVCSTGSLNKVRNAGLVNARRLLVVCSLLQKKRREEETKELRPCGHSRLQLYKTLSFFSGRISRSRSITSKLTTSPPNRFQAENVFLPGVLNAPSQEATAVLGKQESGGFARHSQACQMKSASRRQVKTPVGNKTKRGAELESTPKTPRSLEASPAKPACIDGSSLLELDDQRLQPRSRRPLQWNINPKQRTAGHNEGENSTKSPSQQQAQMKCAGESKAVAALSPICVNAIHVNGGHQGGAKKITGIKKPDELPPVTSSPLGRKCDGGLDRKCRGKAKVLDWSNCRDEEDARSTDIDEGSCPSSPDVPSSGKQMFFWSNAAFNTHESEQKEAVSLSKNAASSSSCSSLASSSRQNEGSIARAESEAESKFYYSSAEDSHAVNNSRENCPNDDRQKGALPPSEECVGKGHPQRTEAEEEAKANGCTSEVFSMTKKNLFEIGGKSSLAANKVDASAAGHIDFPPFSSATKQKQANNKCGLQASGDAAEDEEAAMKDGLDEIRQEIERLTERLAELHLQKRKREEEIQRHKHAKKERATSESLVKQEVAGNVENSRQDQKRAAGSSAGGRMKDTKGAGSSRSPFVRHSPKTQPQKAIRLASRSREESPLTPLGRRAQNPTAYSVSKLSEMRRSVSSTGRRMERSHNDERTKTLRRLSLSGAAATHTGSESRSQPQQGIIKLLPSKSTPARVVSSRYGRAITPDACRPCASESTPSKKRDRPTSASATSSPMPGAQLSASVACSPLKKAATLRSGYPSRSGFSTPIKDRQALIKPTAMVSSSVQLPPSTLASLTSSLTKSQDQTRLLLSSPRCMSPIPRLDSPKSTAALYKCLESLLEDSKHFFKRLSPARPHRLPAQQLHENAMPGPAPNMVATSPASTVTTLSACDCSPKQLLAAMESTLPSINICRMDAMTPRDSGCVKRAADRQKRRFYFAQQEDCVPQVAEATMFVAGVLPT